MFADYLNYELGTPKDLGEQLRYNCPFCSPNNDYKLYVKSAPDKTDGLWICQKCGKAGSPPWFVMQYLGVEFKEALDILEVYDYTLDYQNFEPKEIGMTDEEYLLLLMKNVNKVEEVTEGEEVHLVPPPLPPNFYLLANNFNNPDSIPFLIYLKRRGFTTDDIITHNIGYVLDSHVITANKKTMPIKNHLVFLTHDDQGQYIYWNTRAIGDSYVKSINAPSAEGEYSKRTVVFNLNRAKRTPYIVINEGVPDALTVGESGVGTFGKQVTNEQVALIVKDLHPEQRIYIFLDNDARDQIVTLAERLYRVHKNTYIVINPTNKDANDLGREKAWDTILNHSVLADTNGISLLLLS